MAPLKVCVIGMGKMGLSHASILSTMPEVELVGCVDPDPAAEKLARSVGARAPFFRSTALAFERKPAAAFLCVPSRANLSVARDCVARGAHVFVEKPLAHSLPAAREMLALEEGRPDLRFGVGFMGAHIGTFAKARELLAAGAVGRILRACCRVEYGLVFSHQEQWLFKKDAAGGGAAMSIGSHAIVQIHRLLGPVSAVESSVWFFTSGNEVEDSGVAQLRLTSGAEVELHYDWSAANRPQSMVSLEISGTAGTLRVSMAWLEVESAGQRTATHVSELPDPASVFLGVDGHYSADAEFVRRCLAGGTPAVSWADAYHVQQVIHAIYDSAQRKTQVALE